MNIIIGSVKEDFSRDLFWTRIVFRSDDEKEKTQILVCASQEYLEDLYKLSGGQGLNQEHFDKWLQSVVEKWKKLKNSLFEKDVHYDVYSNTEKGEANGIDFLLTKLN